MPDKQWFFVENGQRAGPVATDELAEMALHGVIAPDTLVWSDGMSDWEEAASHFDFPDQGRGAPSMPSGQQRQSEAVDDMGFPLTSNSRASYFDADPETQGGLGHDGLYVGAPSRGFGEAISVCFRKFATFRGRASRSEYWYFYLFTLLASLGLQVIDGVAFHMQGNVGLLSSIFSVIILLPSISVTVRRLHDTNRSGWWIGGFFLVSLAGVVLFGLTTLGAVGGSWNDDAVGFGLIGLSMVCGFILVIYVIAIIVFMCLRGTPGQNRFG